MPTPKIHCLLCQGSVAYINNDSSRFNEHLKIDHEVNNNQDWVFAGSIIDSFRREKILEAIMASTYCSQRTEISETLVNNDKENRREAKKNSAETTKVILNIDISEEENHQKDAAPSESIAEIDEESQTDDALAVTESDQQGDHQVSEVSDGAELQDLLEISDIDDSEETDILGEISEDEEESALDTKDPASDANNECEFCEFKCATFLQMQKHMKEVHSFGGMWKEASPVQQNFKEQEKNEKEHISKNIASDYQQEKENNDEKSSQIIAEKEKIKTGHLVNAINDFSEFLESKKGPLDDGSKTKKKRKLTSQTSSTKINQYQYKAASIGKLNEDKMEEMEEWSKRMKLDELSPYEDAGNSELNIEESLNKIRARVSDQLKEIEKNETLQEQVATKPETEGKENEVDLDKLTEEFRKVAPEVDISGSEYFKQHSSMITTISSERLRNFNMKTIQNDPKLPKDWFLYIQIYNGKGRERVVRDFITPDRRIVRSKTGVIKFMQISKSYSEQEIQRVSENFAVRVSQ